MAASSPGKIPRICRLALGAIFDRLPNLILIFGTLAERLGRRGIAPMTVAWAIGYVGVGRIQSRRLAGFRPAER
jgi:hypothetical protein